MKKLPKSKSLKSPATKHKRPPVKGSRPSSNSSNVTATSYNPELGQLDVTFAGGRKYRYTGVSKETGSGIASSDSLGRYLHAHVIGKHPVEKLP